MGRLSTYRRIFQRKKERKMGPIRKGSKEKTRKPKDKVINPKGGTLIDRLAERGLDDSQ